MIRSLVLDCDGVLADTTAAHLAAANSAFAAAGLDLSWDEAMYQRVSATAGLRGQVAAYFGRFGWPGGEADNQQLLDKIEAAHKRAFIGLVRAGGATLREDVPSLLDWASGLGWKLGICSDNHADLASACVSRLGLGGASKVSVVMGSEAGLKTRPDAGIYTRIAERLAEEPAACTAIVARPFGAMAARAAGLQAIALAGPSASPVNFGGARIITSLDPGALDTALAA